MLFRSAFNIDLFESDYPKGLVDLIGNNLVGDDLTTNPPTSDYTYYGSLDQNDGTNDGEVTINYLSYKETITESNPFTQRVLDRPGNVMALFGTPSIKPSAAGDHSYLSVDQGANGVLGGVKEGYVNLTERTYWFSEGYVNDVYRSSFTASGQTISVVYDVNPTSQNPYAVINGQLIDIQNTSLNGGSNGVFNIKSSDYSGSLTMTHSYQVAFTLDTNGNFKSYQTSTADTPPLVGATDIVLGFMTFSCFGGTFSGFNFNDITIGTASGGGDDAFIPLKYGSDAATDDFYYQITAYRVPSADQNRKIYWMGCYWSHWNTHHLPEASGLLSEYESYYHIEPLICCSLPFWL